MASSTSNTSTSGTARQCDPITPPASIYLSTPATPRCQYSPTHVARSEGNGEKSTADLLPICRLLSSGFQSDLKITFPDSKQELKVHRMVLEMQSPVLERMLSKVWGLTDTLLIPKSFDATCWLMHHLYCGLRHLPSTKIALAVLQMADEYCINSAVVVATEFLASRVDEGTFNAVLDVAALTSNTRLLYMCDQHLRKHTDEVLDGENFPCISRVALRHLFHSVSFKPSSELLVFTRLVKWAKRRMLEFMLASTSTKSSPLSASSPPSAAPPPPSQPSSSATHDPMPDLNQLRVELIEFLPHVRFLTMTMKEVIQDVMSYGILTPSEGMQLLRVMAGCQDTHLPAIASCQTSLPRSRKAEEESETIRAEGKHDIRKGKVGSLNSGCGPLASSRSSQRASRNSAVCVYGRRSRR